MNQGLHKLVFSKIHHALVVVADIASSQAGEGRGRTRRAAAIWLTLSILPGPWVVMSAWADMPAGISIRDAIATDGTINGATRLIGSDANNINFKQLNSQAIVNYNSLNLSKGQNFNVDMQAGWSMLNRVHSVDPSVINGNVTAAGNIYFINANGVIIGKDAIFNVGSLFAGTLNITDELFKSGFVNDSGYNSVFELVGTVDPVAAAKINNAEVRVESGAQINANKGGKVMLFAPNVKVEKDAVIKTPDGQTILAAGKKIYLKSSTDPAGMLVEVASGGTATNLGQIVAERGNITMMGLAVNQMGTLSATTSVRANGSIRLIAQESVTVNSGVETTNRNGIITLGTGSVTEVKPEVNDTEEMLASQAFETSKIEMAASLFNIDGLVSAKGGNILIDTGNINAASVLNSAFNQRIYLGDHATLDVSGVDAVAPMSRFQLTVQLNSDALKDNPVLRGSNLFGKTVYVDARKGTSLFDLQPYIDSTRMATVAEKMTNAGKVTLTSANEIIMSKGATINVSGGSTTYTAGTLKESKLLYNGILTPISQAQVGVAYAGVGDTTTITDSKWGTTETYTLGNLSYKAQSFFEGGNAGTVTFSSPQGFIDTLVIDGTLLGNIRPSQQQILQQNMPTGASLAANAARLMWVDTANSLTSGFQFNDTFGSSTYVSKIGTGFLTQGFNNINFSNVQDLTVNSKVTLAPNGTLVLGNSGVSNVLRVNQNITAAGGDIQLTAGQTFINDGVTISAAGRFDNNRIGMPGATQSRQLTANSGNITATGLVTFGHGVTLDASAGAYVDATGLLHTGQAGDISFYTNSQLPSDLGLRAYGFDKGGELSVKFGQNSATNLYIGSSGGVNDFSIDNAFFSKGGFSKYSLEAFNIDIGSANSNQTSLIYGVAQNLQMKSGFTNAGSADSILGVTRFTTLPDYARQAVSFNFSTHRSGNNLGVLNVHENAQIMTDPLGSIALYAGKQVNVLGDLTARGGYINLSINDNSFDLPEDASQMVFIGNQAKVDVSGAAIALPATSSGIAQNKVVNGGTIELNYFISPGEAAPQNPKGAIVIKQGAVLDVSGASAVTRTRTNRGYITETLYGDAGAINLYGFGSLLVDGTLSGHATGTGRGGNLSLVFEGTAYDGVNFINDSGRFWVTNNHEVLTSNIQVGDTLKNLNAPVTPATGLLQRAQISAAQIESGGFDNLRLSSYNISSAEPNDRLMLAADLDLAIAGNLVLQTPVLQVVDNGAAQITAGHLQLLSRKLDVDPTLPTGTGSLTLNANQIYIDGLVASSGVNKTTLHAQRDIHGQGLDTLVVGQSVATPAGFSAEGELNLIARQVYPDSGAVLNFTATGANSQINISSSGLAPSAVLSGGGVLNLQADRIVQSGVLKAPFGQIHLLANESIVLADGSLTSVSGNGLIVPYGITDSSGDIFNPVSGVSQKPIDKEITMKAPGEAITLSSGATVDLSGGGELFAYEWIAGGVGGTKDILAEPNTYALIPTMTSDYAPSDRRYTDVRYNETNTPVAAGQTIYITGVAGIPSGTYTLLPARYALVPGAYIVQRSDTSLLRGQTTALQDGSMLTTGYLADMNTGAKDAQWSTFRVIDGSVLRPAEGTVSKAPSQYIVNNASTFFADPLNTNGVNVKSVLDAGRLVVDAQRLVLDAIVVAKKITGHDGMDVDINSDNIRVVNETDNTDTTSLQLLATKLNGLNADSILLGGTRSLINGVTIVDTVASNVSIENNASHSLNTIEFLATATGGVSLAAGATINTGERAAQAKTLNIATNGDGVFFGVSSLSQVQYTRSGSSINAANGTLSIAANSHVATSNSLVMDGSQNVSFAGDIVLADNTNVTLGSNRILLGEVPAGTSGLQVTDHTLTQLDNVSNLTLNSYSTVDTYGDVSFGNDKLNLTINAAGIAGHLADGEVSAPAGHTVTIDAKSVTLKNTVDAVYVAPVDPSGRTLQINAESVRFEGDPSATLQNNTVASVDKSTIGGYDAIQINAKTLTTAQRGELDLQVNQTQLNVGRITAEGSSNYTVATAGTLTTTQGDTTGLAANANFGGTLTLQADNLQVNSLIESLAGQVNLNGTSQVHLGSQAVVSAASTTKTFANKNSDIDAGKVQLNSGSNIVIDSGAVVDVSAKGEADAGKVALSANAGNVQLQGQLDGRAHGTGLGGSLDVDVGTMPSVVGVDQQAVGFSQSRSYRVRNGDVVIDGTGAQALTAKQVTVSADQGAIDVTGTINANSTKSGSITLYAAGDLTLENGAVLSANSSQAGAEGGKVMLATSAGSLNLNQGATIQVAAGTGGVGGSINLRAPRTGSGSGSGVAVNSLQTDILGAQSTILEAFRVYNNVTTLTTGTGTGSTLGFTTLSNDVADFMVNQASILAALGKAGDSSFHLRAGQEIRSNGDLTVAQDWNLYSATRAGNEPGVLTLRATDNLNMQGSLSDGFDGVAAGSNISVGQSWSYRLVAGADQGAANLMNTVAASKDADGNSVTGNLVIAGNKLIRTGTGDIGIAAGGDLVMNRITSRNSPTQWSLIYTAGVSADSLSGFTALDSKALYLDKGGDIQIAVQGNIKGAEADDRQVINQWFFRQGSAVTDTSWWVRPDQFKQSLASFGGGDVNVSAGGNISNFSVSVPTTGRYDNAGNNPTGNSVVNGGGDLTVTAGGDLYNGIYFVGKGQGVIKVGGSISKQDFNEYGGSEYGTALALMDGSFDVSAGKNILIEGVYNPTVLPQSDTNHSGTGNGGQNSYFNTYSERASLNMYALNGDISYGVENHNLVVPGKSDDLKASYYGLSFTPGTLNFAAYSGGISVVEALMVPAASGNLTLLAEKDINISRILMSDANVSDLPSIQSPVFSGSYDSDAFLMPVFNGHANTLLHGTDMTIAMIASNSGSVASYNFGVADLMIALPKVSYIYAGQDITGLNFALQNNRSSDVSVLSAGRDINTQNVVIAGPGELLVKAGRNVDLIFSDVTNIQATGNTGLIKSTDGTASLADLFQFTFAARPNTALPATGSSISLLAGMGTGANVQDYIDRYIAPTGAGPAVLVADAVKLAEYKKNTAEYLLGFMKKFTGDNNLTEQQAYTLFVAQSDDLKTILVNRHLTTELINSAQGFAKAGSHARGYEALDTLYPTKYAGDILLFKSKISTNSGGSIDLIAPGGLINVGVPGRGGDDIGIITEKLGQIRAIADGDFSVNQSKVITQLGSDNKLPGSDTKESDIAIWSTHGTIDAGRGSKTATSVPQRIVQTDVYGNTLVEVRGVATGSGIRAQTYDIDGPNGPVKAPEKGTVYLTAPVVDAGEAGIEAGDLFVVAPVVLNVGNIQVQGTSSGVPTAAGTTVAGINTGLSPDAVNAAAKAVAQNVANSAATSSMAKPVLPSIISVDVIGIGR